LVSQKVLTKIRPTDVQRLRFLKHARKQPMKTATEAIKPTTTAVGKGAEDPEADEAMLATAKLTV
jgi:CBS-domain-containing membrane protein